MVLVHDTGAFGDITVSEASAVSKRESRANAVSGAQVAVNSEEDWREPRNGLKCIGKIRVEGVDGGGIGKP
jgi:hypothetical protein